MANVVFQLHHTGIETLVIYNAFAENNSFSCTILELKRESFRTKRLARIFQLHHTGIETEMNPYIPVEWLLSAAPYWNWNRLKLLWIEHWRSFSCTILELKLVNSHLCFKVNQLSAAPYWNWNLWTKGLLLRKKNFQLHHTGIETNKPFLGGLNKHLSAAPYWNWNFDKYTQIWAALSFQLHHTGIETWRKFMPYMVQQLSAAPYWNWNFEWFDFGVVSGALSAAPYWNWNNNCQLVISALAVFQLHHTGIETCYVTRIACKADDFQLHHTGIETSGWKNL